MFLIAGALLAPAYGAELRITVYDQARLTHETRDTVLDEVRAILRAASIDVVLQRGDPAASEASLISYPPPPPMGREREAVCRSRRDIALEIAAAGSARWKASILGTAEPLAREGLNARVFDDRIRDAAARWNRPYAAVLAHVIAHEIGHVLLRSNAHGASGIMSGGWGEHEYDRLARGLLLFTGDESRKMRLDLSGSACDGDDGPSQRRSVPNY